MLPRVLAAAAVPILALTVTAGTATAGTASAAGARPSFAAQARGYGLSGAQVSILQREVNSYIAQHGGQQIAINEVAFAGGRTVFTVPGQKFSRPVTSAAAAGPAIAADCPHLYFCMYQYVDFGGRQQDFGQCNTVERNTDGYDGSWKNDQTPGDSGYLFVSNPGKPPKRESFCKAWCEDKDWEQTTADVEPCL
jgi:hypothetical protein